MADAPFLSALIVMNVTVGVKKESLPPAITQSPFTDNHNQRDCHAYLRHDFTLTLNPSPIEGEGNIE
jgi:hypothetical protein